MSVQAVRHQLKLSIWRNEGDGTVVLEARQADTLMKLNILQLNWFTLPSCNENVIKYKHVDYLQHNIILNALWIVFSFLSTNSNEMTTRDVTTKQKLTSSVFKQNLII